MTITARYIDTCLSSYLQDGYTRECQILLCASLGCTAEEMRDELIRSACDQMGDIPGSIEDTEIDAAVDAALVGVDLRYIDSDGNRQAEPADDRDDEEPYIYVVLEWEYVEPPAAEYLRELAERLRQIPVMHGVDGGDIDRLQRIASELE
jgi:hypothetical protein